MTAQIFFPQLFTEVFVFLLLTGLDSLCSWNICYQLYMLQIVYPIVLVSLHSINQLLCCEKYIVLFSISEKLLLLLKSYSRYYCEAHFQGNFSLQTIHLSV